MKKGIDMFQILQDNICPMIFETFYPNVPFLYPLKKSENYFSFLMSPEGIEMSIR